ncbi:RNA polymerase sigma factor [Polaromonas sp. JS666]|uniref:RNA polymerase sigma factor n=1 Tax=Polaromonas sp. (strain JS666 / ATCC BAA-500) TaxID=296591 RepID=UPI00088CCAFF|nr:RNA polymerase sigma factor [Polaromonas sp. JS666]SDM76518.1 RNA polymerase sigma-70 factor, ECF subfamily [Polaromonas sp. JS666]
MPSAPTPDNAAEDSDESLMLRYAAGDIAAFDTLYARHELGVWRYVFRSVRVQAVADDLLQDVWFAVARSAPTYTVSARFKTWLFTMAHNRLVDHFRSARHHVSIDASDDEDSPGIGDTLAADSGFGPLRRLESSEQAAALIAAVERLPREQREAFLLQAEAGLSVDEIAAATGVNFETAKSRLRYARNSLRQQLQEFA